MILRYIPFNYDVKLDQHKLSRVIIESPKVFSDYIQALWNQSNGVDQQFVLYEAENELSLNKKLDIIFNPFDKTCNSKRILNSIYNELNEIEMDYLFEDHSELNAKLIGHLERVITQVPYPLTFDLSLKSVGLFGLYGIKVDENYTSVLDKLVSYIKLMHQVCGVCVFAFVNLSQYMSENEQEKLIEAAEYEQCYLIDIEGKANVSYNDKIRLNIIDDDLCFINL